MRGLSLLMRKYFVPKVLIIGLAFGFVGMLTMWAELRVPLIPSQDIGADARELFVVIGAALTGPIGGALTGLVSASYSVFSDAEMQFAALMAHTLAGAALGWVYRWRQGTWTFILVWLGCVALYYVVLVGVFVSMGYFLFPQMAQEVAGVDPLWLGYWRVALSAVPEFLFTFAVTTIAMLALPRKYRQPLWRTEQPD